MKKLIAVIITFLLTQTVTLSTPQGLYLLSLETPSASSSSNLSGEESSANFSFPTLNPKITTYKRILDKIK